MEYLQTAVDLFVHVDEHLNTLIVLFGPWTYIILFSIIFAETGLVVAPFLPGDSMIFAVGSIAALGTLNIWIIYVLLLVAAISGDSFNYWIGARFGRRILERTNGRLVKKEHLEKTEVFFAKHGAKTIVLARFMPIVRTIAPFVAGIGRMPYATFALYNVVGGFVWVTMFTWGGYWFGNIPWVRHNFEYVILGIVATSFLPPLWEFVRARLRPAKDSGSIAS
ncbi:DedA family protein [Patescibacteria group bacterium]|nr:MAG: DedA family protein [Patescibacteria group bacterium]